MSWICSICSSPQNVSDSFCSVCLFSKPLDRKGIPQIFAGFCIHFNGVIPWVLKHPSHAVEWRMAERHGALCSVDFDTSVNLLVYRPGYERSDKCRLCVSSKVVNAVPINWMLDSLLETRQINISLYRLSTIPEIAKSTTTGSNLPHYEHPFFLLKAKEYAISTSFPLSMQDKLSNCTLITNPNQPSIVVSSLNGTGRTLKKFRGPSVDPASPPFFDIPSLTMEMIDVYESALSFLGKKGVKPTDRIDTKDFLQDLKERKGVEITASSQHYSKVDTTLFSGMAMFLSPTLLENNRVQDVLLQCGAKILQYDGSGMNVDFSEATHVVYHRSDKKSNFLVDAVHAKYTTRPGLILCESTWIEDCLMLGELIPPCKLYNPSATLLETLRKRYAAKKESK